MSARELVRPFLVDKPHPLIGAETVQLLVYREVLDYTVLRTEETRDLNTVATPLQIGSATEVRRIAFLGTKQKAAESRRLEHLLRSARRQAAMDPAECYLKDNLCLQCPRCGIYGGTRTVGGDSGSGRANIKHRVEYSTAFSLLPYEEILQNHTFNAINDLNQTTGQALGNRQSVAPATIFPSVITLKSVTWRELVLVVKTLLSCRSYGAESRIGGDMRNQIVGVVGGWEEVITSLEFALEIHRRIQTMSPAVIAEFVTQEYVALSANPSRIRVLQWEELNQFLQECRDIELDRDFLTAAYADMADYRKVQGKA